jgi:Mor family transcriptional regulator
MKAKINIKTEPKTVTEILTVTETDTEIKTKRRRRRRKKKKKVKKKPVVSLRQRAVNTRRRRVLVLYRQGFSCKKIAVKLQSHAQTIRNDLHVMGRHVKTAKTKTKRNAALIQDRLSGKTISDLMRKYKLSKDRVKELIGNYNKTAENPVPDFRELQLIRLSKQKPKTKTKRKKSSSKTATGSVKKKKLNFREKKALVLAKRLERMVAMRKSGSSVKVIAQQYRLSCNRVYQLLHDYFAARKGN